MWGGGGRRRSGLQLTHGRCPPNGSDSLHGDVPKAVPKVVGSGGLLLIPGVPSTAPFAPPEPGLLEGGGRRGEGSRGREDCSLSSGFMDGPVNGR